MPLTLSYDLSNVKPNQRTYIRSMLERFGWRHNGGSSFIYKKRLPEDWLNDVVPSLMFFRSYLVKHKINLKQFTLTAQSTVDLDATAREKNQPVGSDDMVFETPSNKQSSIKRIRRFIDVAIDVLD